MNDKLLILEDTNGDGKADKCTVFADDLHNPTGFEFWNGGVSSRSSRTSCSSRTPTATTSPTSSEIAAARPRLGRHAPRDQQLHVRSGRRAVLPGRRFHHTQVERRGARSRARPTAASSATSRGRRSSRSTSPSTSPTRTATSSTTGARTSWSTAPAASRTTGRRSRPRRTSRRWRPSRRRKPGDVRTRPVGGTEILSSRHFPEAMQGNLLVLNVIGFQGTAALQAQRGRRRPRRSPKSSRSCSSTDANFRPADAEIGPDGALYFTDWHNPIIGHMQHNLRDPTRDQLHGRVYRVTYPGRPLLKPAKIAGAADCRSCSICSRSRRTASATARRSS